MPHIDDLIRLCAGRWLVPIMALANVRGALCPAEAKERLGTASGVARASFDALLADGWLVRGPEPNRRHGTECRLTFPGIEAARVSAAVIAARAELGLTPDALTRWTLPLVAALERERRFSEIAAALRPVSPRALSMTIKRALAEDLIARRLGDEFPPAAFYARTERGERLAAALGDGVE